MDALLGSGDVLVQRRAADTLERLADEGGDFFYRGDFADGVVRVAADAGGVLSREDFERYEARGMHP